MLSEPMTSDEASLLLSFNRGAPQTSNNSFSTTCVTVLIIDGEKRHFSVTGNRTNYCFHRYNVVTEAEVEAEVGGCAHTHRRDTASS